ncbi:(2,3-dihydroxybenzoyl)adenylate synthase [Methylocystis sp. FS]|uniref:(2,3-dihydroxybenzoyl)adenylate synthase n=1 Tax=Methylocystis silviterrae TaxID=2743612 RepID=UPI001581CE12|nr:(2,3-dihydroxybenzoyl)adenylate synthase [Methylocystis silviterrae]NUJ80632.1 (2,3-dihydroxybenzoyl)adenylate synthase [Methylocystis silviterrae]
MPIEFTPWPKAFARRYHDKGYWRGEPLTEILQYVCRRRPDGVALICGDRHLTYAQLDAKSSRLASSLARRGIAQGDTALVQLPNIAEFYIVFFALLEMGVAPVNALFSHDRQEMTAYAQQLRPKLLIASAEHRLFADGVYVTDLRSFAPTLSVIAIHGRTEYAENLESLWECDSDGAEDEPRPSAADQVAFFQLSGGSTGVPKLIPRTHDDYYYSVRRSAEICRLTSESRYLCALPAPHNFPLSSPGALGVFHAGGTVVMARNPSADLCFDLIRRHKVNFTAIVPTVASLWLDAAANDSREAPNLTVMQVGGARLSETVARQIVTTFGCRLQQVFGMAEGLVNYTGLDDDPERIFTTQGRPMSPDDELKVVDADGEEVAAGEVGELLARGPYTIRGYYRSPEHNARAFDEDGFYHTGDLVEMTADGYVKVVGRKKDQINRGGEKIPAEEIENLLLQHRAVVHAALISMPDSLMGERSCAYIVANDAALRPIALRKHLRSQGIAEFKLPDRFEFIDQMPLTAFGKVDKQTLRDDIQAKLNV